MCGIFCIFLLFFLVKRTGEENLVRQVSTGFSAGFRARVVYLGVWKRAAHTVHCSEFISRRKMSFSITQTENDVVLSIFAFSSPLEREQKTLSLIFEDSCPLVAVFISVVEQPVAKPEIGNRNPTHKISRKTQNSSKMS